MQTSTALQLTERFTQLRAKIRMYCESNTQTWELAASCALQLRILALELGVTNVALQCRLASQLFRHGYRSTLRVLPPPHSRVSPQTNHARRTSPTCSDNKACPVTCITLTGIRKAGSRTNRGAWWRHGVEALSPLPVLDTHSRSLPTRARFAVSHTTRKCGGALALLEHSA